MVTVPRGSFGGSDFCLGFWGGNHEQKRWPRFGSSMQFSEERSFGGWSQCRPPGLGRPISLSDCVGYRRGRGRQRDSLRSRAGCLDGGCACFIPAVLEGVRQCSRQPTEPAFLGRFNGAVACIELPVECGDGVDLRRDGGGAASFLFSWGGGGWARSPCKITTNISGGSCESKGESACNSRQEGHQCGFGRASGVFGSGHPGDCWSAPIPSAAAGEVREATEPGPNSEAASSQAAVPRDRERREPKHPGLHTFFRPSSKNEAKPGNTRFGGENSGGRAKAAAHGGRFCAEFESSPSSRRWPGSASTGAGLDSSGCSSRWSRWSHRLSGHSIGQWSLYERSYEKGKALGRSVESLREFLSPSESECIQETEASRTCPSRYWLVSAEAALLQILREAGRFSRAKRLGLGDVAPLSSGRPDGDWGHGWGPRDVGSMSCFSRAGSSRWGQVGSSLGSFSARRSSSSCFCPSTCTDKSSFESFCPSLPFRLDNGGPQLCQRTRPDFNKEDRDGAGRPKEKLESAGQTGSQVGRQEETSFPKEGQAASTGLGAAQLEEPRFGSFHVSSGETSSLASALEEDPCGKDESCFFFDRDGQPETTLGSEPHACKGVSITSPMKSWEDMQEYSYRTWCRSLVSKVLNSRTLFAKFLRTTLLATPILDSSSVRSLYPLPIPKFGIFNSKALGSRARRKNEEDQAVHVMVMALNFLHSDFRFIPVRVLSRRPNEAQLEIVSRLRRILRSFGSSQGSFSLPSSSRRSTHLLAMLSDLSDVVTWQGLSGATYSKSFPGAQDGLGEVRRLNPNLDRAEELKPYRDLDPRRLVLHGTAGWDPSPFLSDPLWMAYQEPEVLLWSDKVAPSSRPNLSCEKADTIEELAKIWDCRGLLLLRAEPLESHLDDAYMKVFNCYKNKDMDRQITDKRARNWLESKVVGDSQGLPPGTALAVIEVNPKTQTLKIACSDRKDFYHQFRIPATRARTNVCWPPIRTEKVTNLKAYAVLQQSLSKKKALPGEERGDFLGKAPPGLLVPDELYVCFNSIGQGDHAGVEFATGAHKRLLQSYGLLTAETELRGDCLFRGQDTVEGLVIDDFYSVSVEAACGREGEPKSSLRMSWAQKAYEDRKLLGSPQKDILDEEFGKITGAEIDSRPCTRQRGLVTLAAPAQKRLALAFVSLELAGLAWTSDALLCCLVGGWTSAAMYRRPFMSVFFQVYKEHDFSSVDQGSPKVVRLSRKVAEELVLMAVLCPLMMTDLGAQISTEVHATDSSDAMGAYVSAEVKGDLAKVLWRLGNKKGGYSKLAARHEALLKKIDDMFQPLLEEIAPLTAEPERPVAFRYHFVEICGGAGKVARSMAARGWNVGPVIDLDRSPFFDLSMIEVLRWLFYMLEAALLDSFIVEPPCTTFSPAAYPPLRSYKIPRGFDPAFPRTKIGTTLALRSLSLMYLAAKLFVPGLLEQPLRSKMAWLEEWRFLVLAEWAKEAKLSACMFGSIHRKDFRLLAVGDVDTSPLEVKCDGSHSHVKIEGKYTKPSAVYPDLLAETMAAVMDKAVAKKLRLQCYQEPLKPGLESLLVNDVLQSSDWKVGEKWRWKKKSHINIQETAAVGRLFGKLARRGTPSRFSVAIDSHVALASIGKGRSPSFGLRPCLRRIAAILIGGALFPSLHFAPTRLNPADHPTRLVDIPEAVGSCLGSDLELHELFEVSSLGNLRRSMANWARLLVKVAGGRMAWWSYRASHESWRYRHWSTRSFVRHVSFQGLLFDKTLGYPGEGPGRCFGLCSWILVALSYISRGLFSTPRSWSFFLSSGLDPLGTLAENDGLRAPWLKCVSWPAPRLALCFFPGRPCLSGLGSALWISWISALDFSWISWTFCKCSAVWISWILWISVLASLSSVFSPRSWRPSGWFGCRLLGMILVCLTCMTAWAEASPSHGALRPRDRNDWRRAENRNHVELQEGRPVLAQTQGVRDKLLAAFGTWLESQGISLGEVLDSAAFDVEAVNLLLSRYGRQLFRAGRPYGNYAETNNAVAGKRPGLSLFAGSMGRCVQLASP